MMFESARLKLTAWYLLIIMFVSISFSVFVYRNVSFEIHRGFRLRTLRQSPFEPSPLFHLFIPEASPGESDVLVFEDVRRRILLQLLIVNAGIFVFSGLAGYFLAGKTLRPIEEMVDEQKRFIADASHELRTPLTALRTEIEVALRNKNLNKEEAQQLLHSNLEEVERMQRLSNYLLTLSRYQNTKTQLTKEVINVAELVTDAMNRVESEAKRKNITMTTNLKIKQLRGNMLSLTELLTILLDNAIKYSHTDSEIIIAARKERSTIALSVTDFGIGIKSSEIPYIFNRFYRADSSRSKTNVDGYGLGLSIAQRIATLHHGTILVESTPAKGSTFTLQLVSASS